jgi:hypothetical protein
VDALAEEAAPLTPIIKYRGISFQGHCRFLSKSEFQIKSLLFRELKWITGYVWKTTCFLMSIGALTS